MTDALPLPARVLVNEEIGQRILTFAVWELTMKCDQPCAHCGSRAGHARDRELNTEELLGVARSLVALGVREVGLIGGEAYLRPDLFTLIEYLAGQGVQVGVQTGGRALSLERAQALKSAGLSSLGVSIDGPARVHDRLRGNLGSHAAALRALENGRSVGLEVTSNMQINRLSADTLREVAESIRARGVNNWQVQLTVPMGRAADHPEWILEPWQVVPVIDTLAAIQREALETHQGEGMPFNIAPANNIGYFGPHEQLLRSRPFGGDSHWRGCQAGVSTIGIESDGTVKACPSLPTAPYAGGNVKDLSLEQIWEHSSALRFAWERSLDELWGYCKSCYYADVCRAGCSWTAHVTLGRRGNNPFCYHRVTQLRKKGIRESLRKVEAAPGLPYDFGRFEITEERVPEPAE